MSEDIELEECEFCGQDIEEDHECDYCTSCDGTGEVDDEPCEDCDGNG